MRKIHFAMAAIAALMLASCVKEVPENGTEDTQIGENTLAFTMGGSIRTRSLDAPSERVGMTFSIGDPVSGAAYYLEETVSTLDGIPVQTPATRGTPAYTSNVASLYGSFTGIAYPLGTITAETTPTFSDGTFEFDGNYWRREFTSDPLGSGQHYLFARMPATQDGVSSLNYAYASGKGTITFDYTSPDTAVEQDDILFAGRPIQKSDFTPTAPLFFQHALTGIKFATDNHISSLSGGTKTYITKVEFIGLRNSGKCTVTPTSENSTYTDTDTYSSATAVSWTAGEGTGNFSQEFDPDKDYAKNVYKSHYDYETPKAKNDGYFPDSFYGDDNAYNDHRDTDDRRVSDWNINDSEATKTFWLIPQNFKTDADLANVKLKVTFIIDAGGKRSEPITRVIENFGTQLKNAGVNWQAGEIRTYTLKATEVAVTVEDEMLDADTKHMVQIRNMGNVPEWVRATVTANWCIYVDADGNYVDPTGKTADQLRAYEQVAVYGYKTETGDEFMDPWRLETEISSSPRYGTFYKSDGVMGFPATGWQAGPGGYYYYTNYIGVDEAATYNLFYSYIVTAANKPTVWLVNHKTFQRYQVEVHLVMDVLVQAILAETDSDGNVIAGETWQTAWNRALTNGE